MSHLLTTDQLRPGLRLQSERDTLLFRECEVVRVTLWSVVVRCRVARNRPWSDEFRVFERRSGNGREFFVLGFGTLRVEDQDSLK